MGLSSFLRSPKQEDEEQEQQVPERTKESLQQHPETIHDIMDDLEGFLGIEDDDDDDEKFIGGRGNNVEMMGGWDLMEWEEFAKEQGSNNNVVVKSENCNVGFWDEDEEKRLCLNLNLNYQDVMDAWSDRGSLWARDCSLSMSLFPASTNAYYTGEVPVMEEEASNRREASVLRYKEKRQCRLFSKKIRYQVRKLNADKRPRLKGRFVKRGGSEM